MMRVGVEELARLRQVHEQMALAEARLAIAQGELATARARAGLAVREVLVAHSLPLGSEITDDGEIVPPKASP